jgi:hypothetical protein
VTTRGARTELDETGVREGLVPSPLAKSRSGFVANIASQTPLILKQQRAKQR